MPVSANAQFKSIRPLEKDDGQFVELDQRMLNTLKTIDSEGSISLACKALGISYRTLWSQIQQYNQLLGEDLVATHGRAGACLTRFGHKLIWMVEQGNVRVAPDLGTVGEQLNAEWLDVDQNKPWISLALSDDLVLQNLFQNTALYKKLQLSLRWSGSIAALSALHRGEVRVAGCHLPVGLEEHSHVHHIMRRWLRGSNLSVIELFERDIGWMSRPAPKPPTLEDVAQRRALLVNRNSASSTHHQLDALITKAGLKAEDLPGFFTKKTPIWQWPVRLQRDTVTWAWVFELRLIITACNSGQFPKSGTFWCCTTAICNTRQWTFCCPGYAVRKCALMSKVLQATAH